MNDVNVVSSIVSTVKKRKKTSIFSLSFQIGKALNRKIVKLLADRIVQIFTANPSRLSHERSFFEAKFLFFFFLRNTLKI